jgi:hypothetical protein
MPQPVSYNPGTPVSGSIQENSISYVVDGQNRNYRGGFGGLSWMSEVPAANNVIFIGNSVSLGRGPANIPLFYPSYNNSAANIIYAANTLPGSPRNFTTTGSAYDWAATNNFFINNSDNPIPRIDADGLVLYVDANQPTSYPQTGTSWYDMSGRNNNGTLINGPTWNSNGWIVFDSTDDYTDTALATNTLFSSNDPFSISITLKPTETINALSGLVCNQKYQSEGSPGGFGLVTYNTNQVAINLTKNDGTGTVSYQSLAPTTLTINSWQNITYTYNPNTGTVIGYKNGTVDNSSTSTSYKWTPEARTTWIARNTQGGWGDFFSSEISNVSIYKKTLSTSEVKQNYFQSNIVQDGLVFMVDANNLVSYPKSGTSTYNLTGSQVGTLTNGVGFSTNNGGYWTFDGVDDYIAVSSPQTLNPGTNSFTIEYWCLISSALPDAGVSCALEARSTSNLYGFLSIAYYPGGYMSLFVNGANDPGQNVYTSTTAPVQKNTWVHQTAVVDRTTQQITFYYNGVQTGNKVNLTDTGTLDPGSGYTYYIGGDLGGNEMNGNIASLRQYNKALTPTEVQQNYQATKDKFLGQNIVTNGLQLSYDFANKNSYPGTGTTIYDLSGNSNNGTLLNNPQFSPNANGGVISWDGTDDYIDTGKTATQLGFYGANYTMEAWVYPTSLTSDRTMFGTNQSALRQGLHLVFRSGQIYQGHYASDFTAGTVTTNNWYQIVYTYNASTGACEIFKNSVSQGTGTISSFIGTTNILIASWGGSYYFEGPGGIYRIYNRVLSSTEILQNYNAQKTRFGL